MNNFPSQSKIKSEIEHILKVFNSSKCEIRPHFFLTGPSGSGKSYLTKQIAEKMGMDFIDINAAQLTSEGISGNSLSKALRPLRYHWDTPNIIFMDEFDKLFQSSGTATSSSKSDIQNEILHALEAKNVCVFGEYGKYDQVVVSNSLFIFAGAFNNQPIESLKDLSEAGLCKEFIGRVPLVFSTQEIPMNELKEVISKTKLFKDYLTIFPSTNKSQAVKSIYEYMVEQSRQSNLGVRLLNSATHMYFMNA